MMQCEYRAKMLRGANFLLVNFSPHTRHLSYSSAVCNATHPRFRLVNSVFARRLLRLGMAGASVLGALSLCSHAWRQN